MFFLSSFYIRIRDRVEVSPAFLESYTYIIMYITIYKLVRRSALSPLNPA
jgi:hypothetical protein